MDPVIAHNEGKLLEQIDLRASYVNAPRTADSGAHRVKQ